MARCSIFWRTPYLKKTNARKKGQTKASKKKRENQQQQKKCILFGFFFIISNIHLNFFRLVLWHGHLREIRCSHGLGIYAFFLFLRWLFFLNLLFSIISTFIWMPFLIQYTFTEIMLTDIGTNQERFEFFLVNKIQYSIINI